MANPTFTLIASNTVGSGGASSVTFSSIPQTYTDLKVVVSARCDNSASYSSLSININGITSGFSLIGLEGGDSTTVSSYASSTNAIAYGLSAANSITNAFGNVELYLPNYTSSNYKSISSDGVSENNSSSTGAYRDLIASLWSNTAAITSLTFTGSGNFVQYSTFSLYGIKNS